MSLNACIFISDINNYDLGLLLASKLMQQYNIRSMLLTNNSGQKHPSYELVKSLESVQNNLVMARLSMVFTDEKTDWENPGLSLIAIWADKMEVYFSAKKYNIANELDNLIVAVAKERTKLASVFHYSDSIYQYTDEGEPTGFGVNVLQPVANLTPISPPIMLHWNFTDPETHRQKWLHLTETLPLKTKPNEALFDVVINCTMRPTDPNRTIYFCMEPFGEKQYAQYLQMLFSNNQKPMFLGLHRNHLNNCEWHLKPSLSQLKNMKQITKTKENTLSVVVSNKAVDPGHKYRLALIKKLDDLQAAGRLQFGLDIFGRCQSLGFKNYRGELPDQEKDQAIWKYKYHLNVENHFYDNYITEKLYDSICGACLTFYKGAGNFKQFFDSPVPLSGDMNKLEDDVKLISDCILNDEFSKRGAQINSDRHKLLYQYAFEPRVKSIIQLAKTACFVADESMKMYMLDQGFGQATVTEIPFKLDTMISSSLNHAHPILIKMSKETYPNLLDRLCFTLSANPTTDIIGIKEAGNDNLIDILILPSGQEQMLKNIVQKRSIFEKLKLCKML